MRFLKNLNEGHVLLTLIAGACGGGAALGAVNIKRQYTQYNDIQRIEDKSHKVE